MRQERAEGERQEQRDQLHCTLEQAAQRLQEVSQTCTIVRQARAKTVPWPKLETKQDKPLFEQNSKYSWDLGMCCDMYSDGGRGDGGRWRVRWGGWRRARRRLSSPALLF
eukprot:1467817-Rhodomonas_salina.1